MLRAIFSIAAVVALTSATYGIQTYGKQTVATIEHHGNVSLEGTKVTKRLEVFGKLSAKDATIAQMQVFGEATLSHCQVQKKSTVHGMLTATESTFNKELSVATDHLVFTDCTLHGLRVLKSEGHPRMQIVELRGDTKVMGSIIFEGKNGEVLVEPESEIKGKVVGGKLRM